MATRVVWKSLFSSNLHQFLEPQSVPRRPMFYWITLMFNNVDTRRVAEVGSDRACAEWLLKNGAAIKWTEGGPLLSDYNALPSLDEPRKHIQVVDATDSAISHIGFPHFKGCNHINEVKLVNCVYIEDPAIPLLSILKDSLNNLEVNNCANISEKALNKIDKLSNLKTLKLGNLPLIKDKNKVIENLTKALPNCDIVYN
ncbi:ATP synthase subunit s, mitochondrial isoform X2 [Athalia rosae]|uniref:ATP synthase subunit s, mitochondrial isoform X2 n=1 Tax=Athalia rosae TaxID=37344 RepID=UPI0020335888|nr:ATP synthase subunit s, mitochondrial isoform X2 [Athalia rosae]